MHLTRRSMRSPGNIQAAPGLVGELLRLIKEQAAAAARSSHGDISKQLETIMIKLDELLDAVASQQTQIDSLIELNNGLHKSVIEAMGATITPSQQMRIDQVFDAVRANADDIAKAIKENTPEATAGAVSGGVGFGEIKGGGVGSGPMTDAAGNTQSGGKPADQV